MKLKLLAAFALAAAALYAQPEQIISGAPGSSAQINSITNYLYSQIQSRLLDPTTAPGDMIYRSGTGTVRLAAPGVGTWSLHWDGTAYTWIPGGSGGGAQADWNASSGPSQILNQPILATVAKTGSYTDLSNAPPPQGVLLSGNTLTLATVAGTVTGSKCVHTDASGNITETVAECGSGVAAPSVLSPLIDGTAAAGSAVPYSREDHVHPVDTSRMAASNPTLGSGYLSGTKVAGAAGVTANSLCKLNSTGFVVNSTVSDLSPLGVCVSTKTSGQNVEVATRGAVSVTADNATTIGHIAIPGTTTAGTAKDSGVTDSTGVPLGTPVVGIFLSTTPAGQVASMQLYGPGHFGATAPAAGVTASTLVNNNIVTASGAGALKDSGIAQSSLILDTGPLRQNCVTGVGGVTGNTLVKVATDGTCIGVTGPEGIYGIAMATTLAGATGDVVISGPAQCIAEGAIVAGNYIITGNISPTRCKDSGQSALTSIASTVRVAGKATASAVDGATFNLLQIAPYMFGASPGGTVPAVNSAVISGGTTRPPNTLDDTAHGATLTNPYWINQATGDSFQLLDATTGAASWAKTTPYWGLPADVAGANVKAAYSLYKIVNAYAGNALTLKRASDSTTQAIGFVNGYVDGLAAGKFCAGTVCSVSLWNDQSGAANDCVQATLANSLVFGIDTLGKGLTLTGSGNIAVQYCTMPVGVAVTNPNLSIVAVAQPSILSTGETLVNLGPNAAMEYSLMTVANAGVYKIPAVVASDPWGLLGTTAADNGPAVYAVVQNGSGAALWINETSTTAATTGNTQAFTGGQIGFEAQYSAGYTGNISTVIIKSVALTAAERLATFNALYRLHGISPQYAMNSWIALGDSITAGTGASGSIGWPTLAARQLNTQLIDVGVPGTKCSDIDTKFAAYTAPLKSATARNSVLSLLCGTNDGTTGATAAAAWASIVSIIGKAVAAGIPIVVHTVLPIDAPRETPFRTTLNASIRSGAIAAGATSICDFAASPVMGQAGQNTSTTYYAADHLHPSSFGHSALAGIAVGCIQPLLSK